MLQKKSFFARVSLVIRDLVFAPRTRALALLMGATLLLVGGLWHHASWMVVTEATARHSLAWYCATVLHIPWWLGGITVCLAALFLCLSYTARMRGLPLNVPAVGLVLASVAGLCSRVATHTYQGWLPGGVIGMYVHALCMKCLPSVLHVPVLATISLVALLYALPMVWILALLDGMRRASISTGIPALMRYLWRAAGWWVQHAVTRLRRWLPAQPPSVYERTTIEKLIDEAYTAEARSSCSSYLPHEQSALVPEPRSVILEEYAHDTSPTLSVEEMAHPSDADVWLENEPRRYATPDLNLLHAKTAAVSSSDHQAHALRAIEEKLARFGIKGTIVSVTRGPSVTLYEYAPEGDVKLSRILAFEDDIALAVQALSVRILAPIPGSSVVGFEVARADRDTVLFGNVARQAQTHSGSHIPLVIGMGSRGEPYITDLVQAPHVLIAGSTGSGKSVALHTVIVSALYSTTPANLRMILIDPKRLEFSRYAHMPHLAFPIITDVRAAVDYLQWAVTCMEERYETLSQAGVRSIAEYHDMHGQEAMPYIMIVIDELADLMMTAGKDVEWALARLAQMSRAAGIHLVVATQRPSVDVITGLIKVNIPTRVACRVASKIDSRTILDDAGAEKLLGKGDMLILDAKGRIERVQGAYISEAEIEAVVAHMRRQGAPDYWQLPVKTRSSGSTMEPEDTALYQDIVHYLRTVDTVSISQLQRQFDIGYNRSARMIEVLAQQGVVMAMERSKMRKVVHEHAVFETEQ